MNETKDANEILQQLCANFDESELKWRVGATSGNRCLPLVYVDARVVMDRLDDVLGSLYWQDEYKVLPDNSVECTLRICINDTWIAKSDVGSPSEQPDAGDRMKAAYSDALKRAAVKFGIGRYLYRFPQQWVDYDPQKKRIAKTPVVPDWAKRGGSGNPSRGNESANPPKSASQADKQKNHVHNETEICNENQIKTLHGWLLKYKCSWYDALTFIGKRPGDSWEEPSTEDAVKFYAGKIRTHTARQIMEFAKLGKRKREEILAAKEGAAA